MNLTWFEVLLQVIGFLGTAFMLIATQFNTHGKIMIFKTLGSFSFCVQYLLMGAYTGMVMDIVGTIRNIVFAYNVKKGKSNKFWIFFFSAITIGAGVATLVLTWSTLVQRVSWLSGGNSSIALLLAVLVSIISILAKLLSTIAYAFKDAHRIRMLTLPTSAGWLVYNVVVFTLAGIINESLTLISIVIAELRFRKKPEKISPTIKEDLPVTEQAEQENQPTQTEKLTE